MVLEHSFLSDMVTMENQKEFDELAKKVDSLMSIQEDLVREFKDNYNNPSPQLITSIKNLSAKLKAVQDRLSKVKVDEGLPEPSSGFTPKIDADEVTSAESKSVSSFDHSSNPPPTTEGKGRYETKTRVCIIDGVGTLGAVQVYHRNSMFLDYQEGKPFFSEYMSHNAVLNFQVRKVTNIEVDILNHALKDKFQQFEGWKFIEEDNLNQFSSYFIKFFRLYFVTHPSQITYVCDISSSVKYARLLFDRGKEIESVERCFSYDENILKLCITSCLVNINWSILIPMDDHGFVYELVYEHGYWSDLMSSEKSACILTKGVITSTGSMLFDKMPENKSWSLCFGRADFLLQLKMNKVNECPCCSLSVDGKVFDCGRLLELIRSQDACELFHEILQQVNVHCIFEYTASHEGLLDQLRSQVYHPAVEWSSQVITVDKLEDGVPSFHDYFLVVVSLVVKRYCELLKLKRGYREVGICERIVEIKKLQVGANGGESITKEIFDETSNEVVGVFTQLGDAVLRMGMNKRFKEADWVVDDARLGVGRLQQITTYACAKATSSAEYHITRVSIYKFEEVRVILVTLLHSSSCVTLVHLQ
ncbi:hypothetical protein MKW98_002651 [Papaver atlanticum]|uniref:Uncharacterized protein n=1 Tax=Papaver atlanticum TaxID=357466 RepID=A0AAD4XCJ2_9MAGN|nr:hypothetical protein MKW98_002651 [Papaver atlanticum]